jgi:hypothetical protein
MRKSIILVAVWSCALTACASTPKDMTVHYFLPRVDLELKVTKSVACDPKYNLISVVNATTHNPIYSAASDADAKQAIRISDVDGFFSDADLTFDFKDDGRLSGVNVVTTGQGEQIVKSALALVQPFMAAVTAGEPQLSPKTECGKIAGWGGENKTISLTYEAAIPFARATEEFYELVPDASSVFYHNQLTSFIGSVCVKVGKSEPRPVMGVDPKTAMSKDVLLTLRQPAVSRVQVGNYAKPGCQGQNAAVWSSLLQVPQHGTIYAVLIPKAAAFGKQDFTLALSEAGTVTQLKYGKTNGVASALNAGTDVVNAATVTPAERKQQAEDEMAAIAAQEKLAACLADHSKCGG